MTEIVPSQIVSAIDSMFGSSRSELHTHSLRANWQVEVRTLLELIDDVPRNLLVLPFAEYLEFTRCRAVLAASVAKWSLGETTPAGDVSGKDPVERIRRLISKCSDELPPREPILTFIDDADTILAIEDQIRAAWTDFSANEWIGATVMAGAALEGILYWSIRGQLDQANNATLNQMIEAARKGNLITEETKQQAKLAKDARNLIHPGRIDQSGNKCSRATALTALAAVYRVSDDLYRHLTPA